MQVTLQVWRCLDTWIQVEPQYLYISLQEGPDSPPPAEETEVIRSVQGSPQDFDSVVALAIFYAVVC